MKIIGHAIWDAKTGDIAKHTKLYRRKRDALRGRPQMVTGETRPGISVLPIYVDPPGEDLLGESFGIQPRSHRLAKPQ